MPGPNGARCRRCTERGVLRVRPAPGLCGYTGSTDLTQADRDYPLEKLPKP